MTCANSELGFVSLLCDKLKDKLNEPVGSVAVGNVDLKDYDLYVNWQRVWNSVALTSRSSNNQFLHYKSIQRRNKTKEALSTGDS